MDNRFLQQNNNIEQIRQNLAEKVKVNLEKYKDQITQFNFLTYSKTYGGFWDTNEGVKPVVYDSRYDNCFESNKKDKDFSATDTWYLYANDINKATFQGYLGRGLTGTRDGNVVKFTLKFEKGFDPREVINSIVKLIDTLIAYRGQDNSTERTAEQDIKDIAKESITVLEAFLNISEKFPSNGHISVKSMIEEYKEIINSSK